MSRKLKISPHDAMTHMEKLYNEGYISYPRTETQVYAPSINLKAIVVELSHDKSYAEHAGKILSKV